jgi:adenine-specific DNA-methyltransferase
MHARHKFSGRHEVISWYSKTNDYYFSLDPVRVPQKQPTKKFYKGPKKGQISSNPLGKNPGDVWQITNIKNGHPEKIEGGHPCQFPIELAERLILSMTKKGSMVVDPFGGVATTLVAALKHGRLAISSEINKDYHKLGKQRITQLERGNLPYKGRFHLDRLDIKD